jgi:hypothetical protein
MTIARATVLLLVFGLIALCVVHLRGEQTRAVARIQVLAAEEAQLRQTSWHLQMAIARLKRPDAIRKRIERWQVNVSAPSPGPAWSRETGLAEVR